MFEGLRLARLYTIEAVNATPARASEPSVTVQKFASFSPPILTSEFLNLNHTKIIDLLVSFQIRISLWKARRSEANFGFGTLGGHRRRDGKEIDCFQARPTDQAAIDVGERQDFGGVAGLQRSAVEQPHGDTFRIEPFR